MKIALFGATGMVGSRIAAEAAGRGHRLTAVSRSGRTPEAATGASSGGVTAVAADAADTGAVAELAAGHDAVAAALVPPRDGSEPRQPFLSLYQAFLEGVRAAGVTRLVVVGGAGSLEVGPGARLMDQPGFPDAYRGEALAHLDLLTLLGEVADLDWTCVSPAAEIAPGQRTGSFRTDGDQLLAGPDGRSRISAEDYAIAFVDELEQGAHPRRRISVAY